MCVCARFVKDRGRQCAREIVQQELLALHQRLQDVDWEIKRLERERWGCRQERACAIQHTGCVCVCGDSCSVWRGRTSTHTHPPAGPSNGSMARRDTFHKSSLSSTPSLLQNRSCKGSPAAHLHMVWGVCWLSLKPLQTGFKFRWLMAPLPPNEFVRLLDFQVCY